MRSLIVLGTVLFSFSSFAQSLKGNQVSTVTNKSTGQEIVYTIDGANAHFYLKDGSQLVELNNIKVTGNPDLRSEDKYSFNITKSLVSASGKAYYWCWATDSNVELDEDIGQNAFIGLYGAFIGVGASVPLCAIGPAVPAVVGVALAPIDGVITLSQYLFKKDEITARKFNELLRGRSTSAKDSVFNSLRAKIIKL